MVSDRALALTSTEPHDASDIVIRMRRERPEGWRTLKLGALELWWGASEPRVTPEVIDRTLTIVRADGSGKQLVVRIRGVRTLATRLVTTIAIEPAHVRRFVEQAAPRGAWPTGTGSVRTEIELAGLAW